MACNLQKIGKKMAKNNNKDVNATSLKQAIYNMLNKYGKTKQKQSFIKIALSGNKTMLGVIFAMIFDAMGIKNTINNAVMFLYLCGMYTSKVKDTVTSDTLNCFDYKLDKNNNIIKGSLKIKKIHITQTNGMQFIKGIASDSTISKFAKPAIKASSKDNKLVWIVAIQVIADYKGIKASDIIDTLQKKYSNVDSINDIKLCDIKSA